LRSLQIGSAVPLAVDSTRGVTQVEWLFSLRAHLSSPWSSQPNFPKLRTDRAAVFTFSGFDVLI
jgi:hypothetical protein